MSIKNTGAFTQFPRLGPVNIGSANGSTITTPTNTGLLYVAGPDGADIWTIGAIATGTQTSLNTLQFFVSKDFGATFFALPLAASFAAGAAISTVLNVPLPNAVPGGPTNPLVLGGVPGPFTHAMQASSLTESATWFAAQYPTSGSANAQAIVNAYNTAGTLAGSALAQGRMFDFVAGFTNSGALTLAVSGGSATAVQSPLGTALTANEVTKGFRYRVIDTGTVFVLIPTDRLYVAMTQSQAVTFTAWGADR